MSAVLKQIEAETSAAFIPVTLSVNATARRRSDLPDVWTAEVEMKDGRIHRQHFRQADDGSGLEDCTELVADLLLDRARAKKSAERHRQAEQVTRVGSITTERFQRATGRVVVEGTLKAGQTRGRALTSPDTLNQRKLLTMRQHEAAGRLHQDAKMAAGAKDARDDAAPPIGSGDPERGRCWEDFVVSAGRRIDQAREAAQRMPAFEGVLPWSVVEAICVHDRTLTDVAGSNSPSVLRRFKVALRIGLDAVADAYGMRSEVTTTAVLHDGVPYVLAFTVDRDGPDANGSAREVWRSTALRSEAWVEVAESMSALYVRAREKLRALDARNA